MKKISSKAGNSWVVLLMLMAAVLWLLPVGNAAAVVTILDDFDTPPAAPTPQAIQIVGPSIGGYVSSARGVATGVVLPLLNNSRFIDLGVVNEAATQIAQASVTDTAVNNRYAFSLPDLTDGSGSVVWDGAADAPPVACGLALNLIPYDKFVLGTVTADHPFILNMTVWNATCTASATVAIAVPIQTLLDINVPFTNFSNSAILNGTVGRIKLDWATVNGVSSSLDWSMHSLGVECDLPAPGVTLTANPTTIIPPACSQLCWTYSGTVTSASIDQGIGPIATTPGCVQVCPTVSTTYTITAHNGCAPATATATVQIGSQPPGKVPNLTEWGTIILSLILAVSAVVLLRRKRSVS